MALIPLARAVTCLLAALLAAGPLLAQEAPPDSQLSELSLEDLLTVRIVSASNTSERLADAPATVVVLTREELAARGYLEMSEILDDLPGMQVVRPYGDTYLKNYWRGYRNTIGEPFLVMTDGLQWNHLYFNTADILAALPLSSVERVEVVYGPASSVYGANAFMGVINVITRQDPAADGGSGRVMLGAGSFGARLADASFGYRRGDLRASLTVRLDDGHSDPGAAESYEYTRARYVQDRALWGGFLDNPNIAGTVESPHRNRAFDARVGLGDVELGFQHYLLEAGYGVEYARDRAQDPAVWSRPEYAAHLRARRAFGERVRSTTLVRYRESGVDNESFFLEGYPVREGGAARRVVDFSFWQSLNHSWSVFQDVEVTPRGRFSLNAGLKYEQKDLQKAYDNPYGPSVAPERLNAAEYPFPAPPIPAEQAQNRITTDDRAAYAQVRFQAAPKHRLNLGMRYDDNSKYGSATTVRAGYVGQLGRFVVKALYGEGFQEPTPRLLYGGWKGSGSDPDLRPEHSRTLEGSSTWATATFSATASLYHVRNRDTIVNTAAGAENVGERNVVGFDVMARKRVAVPRLKQLTLWGSWSRLLHAEESPSVGPQGEALADGRIGDLADDSVHLGASVVVSRHLSGSLRGRLVGARETVRTNPVGEVASFATVDLTATLSDLGAKGLGLTARVSNLFDATYAHPGLREASAGTVPGRFVGGLWDGSDGFYSSLLPQPGRAFNLTATFTW